MRSWVLAAGLLAAAAAAPALAADLDDGSYPPRYGGYDGPRYPPPSYPPSYDEDEEDDEEAPPARKHSDAYPPSYDDDDDNGNDDLPPARKHSGAYPPACTRGEDIRDRLASHGWRDFHAGRPGAAEMVMLRARRPSGRLFELTLERCSGRLVDARPLERRRLRPFGPGEFGRWDRYESDDPWFGRPYAYRWPRRPDRDD